MKRDLDYRQGIALVVAGTALWSLMGLAIRMTGDAGTWQVLFYRSLGMVPALLLVVVLRSGGKVIKPILDAGWPGVIGAVGLVFAFSGGIYAIQSTTVANAVFLFAAAPLITAALAWPILGERVRPATWVAIALAAAGIFTMVRTGLSIGAGAGNIAGLLSATGFAAFTIALRRGRLTEMMPSVVIGGALSIAVSAAVIIIRGESFALPAQAIVVSLGMGICLLGLGMAIYTLGSRAVPAAEMGILSMTEVMLAPFWVWLVLGETVTRGTLVGGAILLAAIGLNALSGLRWTRRPQAPINR